MGSSLDAVSAMENIAEVFVVGGQTLYEEALSDTMINQCKLVIATRINREYDADVFMPTYEDKFEPLFISQTYS